MKNHLIAAFLFVAIFGGMLLAVGCQPPGVTQGTVEIDYVNNNGCSITANVDGSQSVTFVTTAQFYTFTNTVTPGTHILNFGTGGACNGPNCLFPNSSTHESVTFDVGGGDVYEETVSEGGSCNNILLSGS